MYAGIDIYEGRPGSGKSYDVAVNLIPYYLSLGSMINTNILVSPTKMVKFVHERYGVIVQESSIQVWDGAHLWENIRTISPKGTRKIPNCIFLDEAHKYANSRDWNVKDSGKRENFMFCTEIRHFHIYLGLITQDANNIDAQFRRLAQFYFRYRDLAKVSLPFMGRIYPMAHTMKFTIDYDGKTKMAQELIPRKPIGFELYDSHAAQVEESWADQQASGHIVKDTSKQRDIIASKVGYLLISLVLVVVIFMELWQ